MQENDVIEQWNHEEQAVRARLRPANAPRPTLRPAGLSGLEVLDAIFAGELPPPPMGETLDFLPIRMTPGEAVFQGRPQRRHYNPLGTVHGGWFATLLDSALGCAVHTCMPPGRGYTTAELGVNLVKALTPRVPRVRAEGRVLHCGRQLATAEARLVGPDGTLYAHATTTCLVFEATAR